MTKVPILEARWEPTEDPAHGNFQYPTDICVTIKEQGFFRASIIREENGNPTFVTKEDIEVTSEHNKGTGTRLMMGAFGLAQDCGILTASGLATSAAALAIRQKLFGDAMFFHEPENTDEVPMTTAQALGSLQRAIALAEKGYSLGDPAVGVVSDLSSVDTSSWERPRVRNNPPPALLDLLGQCGITPPLSIFPYRRPKNS